MKCWWLALALALAIQTRAQEIIRFKKEFPFAFYPLRGCDTLRQGSCDTLVLVVPELTRPMLLFRVDNGRLSRVSDSLVTLSYMPGMQYESLFVPDSATVYHFRTRVNGPSAIQQKVIGVKVYERKENGLLDERRIPVR